MSACVRVCVCVCAYAGAGVCLREYNLCDPACSAPPFCHIAPPGFSTLSRKRRGFRKKKKKEEVTEHKMRGLIFILRRTRRDIATNVKTSSCKVGF